MNYSLFVSCPRGLEYLLEEELKSLGLHVTRVSPQGVYGEANLAIIYHICLWSRLANRVQLILFNGQAHNEQTIYKLCSEFAWQTVFTSDKTFAIEFHGSSSQIRNSMYGAQVVKDAIVDHFHKLQNKRPSIERHKPDILLHAYLKQSTLTVSFDLTGYSLHQRGYRKEAGIAPLKENVAAAMLFRANWPKLAASGYALQDPFCGSGTLLIEGVMMAARIAPGLLRTDQSLIHWVSHQSSLWEKIRSQALSEVKPVKIKCLGTDVDARLIQIAEENAKRAGVAKLVSFESKPIEAIKAIADQGLLISNPPYGERLSDATQLIPLYQKFGHVMYEHFQGWEAAFITSNPMLAKATGLRSSKQYTLFNGALECKLYCMSIRDNQLKGQPGGRLSENAQMFSNRLQKNVNHLKKWAKRNQVSSYRVYDADLPEYAFAIDYYDGYVVLQEYAPPASVPIHKAEQRSLEVMQVVPTILNVSPNHMVVKQRRMQKGKSQYEKMSKTDRFITVQEGQAKFKVNLYDYLDTGLFLDHRPLRLTFAKLPEKTRFLNCFCYTASASVHAALAGAITTNVDLSKTYLDWAKDNFALNNLDLARHQFIQYDCLEWLNLCKDKFDVIFLDPPSFSNSKRMKSTLDIQRDHVSMIASAMRLLQDNGVLYFSTNFKRFKIAPEVLERYEVEDITLDTIDEDFKRSKRIHYCYRIKKK
ncbi:bifunctional 23S rRNA (guanine(2069)-N(7))-methyltransferase RlmK/23S rRNA (guanine(2445)-N(2))-methyltransferase RlmL [Legionella impletisoli]|uniref:Ribosomal RNA large subunit methyltransferase K/L n=1 Tax=Legionella impletisoli TaxID=343510 RepID=A0A917NCF1_9GAMM|nr:bifunctional 23S rRNA (guanine(2069)-N(7))-methyltransferase RlmK/23S rRNA (guanine(2445)-N(2))-methyltransferase RlmL [Legionella impletisoli]GGI87097.1 ribosomal RNA large subunit methyltransferase K/L [Legionella impletisoli]